MRDMAYDERELPYGTDATLHKLVGHGIYAVKASAATTVKASGSYHGPLVINANRLLYHPTSSDCLS